MTQAPDIQALSGQSMNLTEHHIEQLKQLFPNVFTEGKIDFDALKSELGEFVETESERYQFTWAGKEQAKRIATTPSLGTLRPAPEESVNWDSTENLYIEGDNLEVLKLLQKSYFGKVKMIYIDPPYNTGKDFVYKDDFKDNLANYQRLTGQKDDQGNPLTTNSESAGRYHSNWLNMMYPRLKLARNLLRDDGVIFISIDDNEVHNLRKICDEIFGEGNFVGLVSWLKKRKGSFLSKKIISISEYCLVYGKTADVQFFGGKPDVTESQPLIKRTNSINTLMFPANVVKTKLQNGEYKAGKYGDGTSSVELLNDLTINDGLIESEFSLKGPFIWGQENLNRELANGAKVIVNTINFQVRVFKSEDPNSFKGMLSSINGVDIAGTNEDGYEQLRDLLETENIMDYPKPVNYIKQFITSQTYFKKNDIILDFFSGSATTAHAVMQLNAEDGGNRKYILVQIPEPTPENSEARKAGYATIAEIGKERIRRAAKKVKEEHPDTQADLGFKVLKLDTSNIKKWNPNLDTLETDLLDAVDNILPDRSAEDLLYEVLIKYGLPLTLPIKKIDINSNGKTYQAWSVAHNSLVACFDENITLDTVQAIANLSTPDNPVLRVVFRDTSFTDDITKTNAIQRLKQTGIEDVLSI